MATSRKVDREYVIGVLLGPDSPWELVRQSRGQVVLKLKGAS